MQQRQASLRSRVSALLTTVALTSAGLAGVALVAPAAAADISKVAPPTPSTVTADALPTVQIDGVVWQQAVLGNTVYAAGRFTNARPAGAAAGVNTTPRNNLLAYDITTGNLINSFAPDLNGQALALALSPDGTRLYVGGDFTTANGSNRYRIAAYNTATGALVTSFAPVMGYRVNSIVATNTTVYVGGDFNSASGNPRGKLAAFNASNGALLAWNPTADAEVKAMTLTPDGSKLIVGGRFQNVAGTPQYGLAALDVVTGATQPWAANQLIRNAGTQAAINSLRTDGTNIYGTGYVFGAGGNFEGTFAADPNTGTLRWLEDCHGDTYDTFPVNGVVYTVSHAHYCTTVGGFFQSEPWATNMRHALAFTANATGTVGRNEIGGYYNFEGNPAPSMINWFPDFYTGSFTGQGQAAWTVAGNGQYVVMGGEFPGVNGAAQQGLVRFAVKPISPSRQGPRLTAANFVPNVVSLSSGTVRVAFGANWDRDNKTLNYRVVRNGDTARPVYSVTADSTFWERPNLGFVDSGLAPGSTVTYRLYANDSADAANPAAGNVAVGNPVTVTVSSDGTVSPYAQTVKDDGASTFWRLSEPSGPTAYDWASFNDGAVGTGVGRGVPGSNSADTNTASSFDGTANGLVSAPTAITGPDTFTTEAWIKTTSTSGGKIIGFGNAKTAISGNYDRHTYMDNAGRIVFGVYPGGVRTINSAASYNDGNWHQVVSTLGPNGMALYVDGQRVAARTDTTWGQPYTGYWRVGGDNLNGWTSRPSSNFVAGAIDDVSIYPTALSADQVARHYRAAGGVLPNVNPTAAFTTAASFLKVDVDGSGSTDSDGTIVSHAWNFGDGGTATGATASHTYGTPGNYAVTLTVTDDRGGTHVSTKTVTVNAPPPNAAPTAAFTTTATNLKLDVDGTTSTDTDGSVSSYAWDFGDGSTASGATATHTYAAAGTYNVKLTVTDNGGAAGTITTPVTVAAPPPNQPPTAGFTSDAIDLAVDFDAGQSADADGTISTYAWDFGDGSQGSGQQVSRTYAAAGTYRVTLIVTDDNGATAQQARDVTVTAPPPPNVAPTAAFTAQATNLDVDVDATASSDPDGTIASYAWDFGDGTTGTGATAEHSYATAGTYNVKLTVTDNAGTTGTVTSPVMVAPAPPANVAPTARFVSTATGLQVNLDASTSADPDGTIASYAWDFGDGATGSGASPSHTYAAAGTHQVTLTVTDNAGATDSITQPVTTQAPANVAPTAAFTSTTTGLKANVDASASADPDGTVASYAWDFGDGGAGTGATADHTYAAAGTYQVKLTVTDNVGATGTVTSPVTVAPAEPKVVASDNFGRTLASGWGAADQGGSWTLSDRTSLYSASGSAARLGLQAAGSGPSAFLNAVSARDVDAQIDFSLDKATTGGGVYEYLAVRRVGTSDYRLAARVQSNGAVTLTVMKVINGTETNIATSTVAGLSIAANDVLRMRFKVTGTGTTTLTGKAWKVGTNEPGSWQVSTTDSQAQLQAAGAVGVKAYVSGSATNAPLTVTLDNLLVREAS